MSEIPASIGALALILFYCAWFEDRSSNRRDAKLLAAAGATGLLVSSVALGL